MPRLVRRSYVAAACVAALAGCGGGGATPAELAGAVNADGVRDDVATHITGFAPELRGYLTDVAVNEQQVVTFDPDTDDAYRIAQEANRLVTCTPDGIDAAAAWDAATQVRERVADNSARRARRAEFTAAIDGRSFPAPSCDTAGAHTLHPDG